ncbi:hypothetical protein EON79_15905 [bacterium]|nr:MAG: hypothetical protein EON79_15905 [bacterium]
MRLQNGESRLEMDSKGIEAQTQWVWTNLFWRLDPPEPLAWADALERLSVQGYGAETIRSHSGHFQATFAMAKKDELHVSVLLQYEPDFLDEFRLFFNLPQSELPRIIWEFRQLLV